MSNASAIQAGAWFASIADRHGVRLVEPAQAVQWKAGDELCPRNGDGLAPGRNPMRLSNAAMVCATP
jgi:hypothetical protein